MLVELLKQRESRSRCAGALRDLCTINGSRIKLEQARGLVDDMSATPLPVRVHCRYPDLLKYFFTLKVVE